MDSINMIGYDAVHPSDFVYDMPGGHGYYLLILTHTPLRFRDSDGERIYPARHAALFSPDARIHYGACEATYSNDWIIFDSDEPYVTQFPLQNRPSPSFRCKTVPSPCRTQITATICSSCSPGSTCRAVSRPSPPS